MENKKIFKFTLIASYIYMVISMILGFVIVPISLKYWGADKYGIWTIITTIGSYITLSNLGINTSISVLMGKASNYEEKLMILKKGIKILFTLSITFLMIFILFDETYPQWYKIVGKIPDNLKIETYASIRIFIIFFFINLTFSILTSALIGFYKVYIENIFATFLVIINALVLFLVMKGKGNLTEYVTYLGISILLLNLLKSYFVIIILNKEKKVYKYEHTSNDISTKKIMELSLQSFFQGIAATITGFSSSFIISNILGVEHITSYNITYKLFSIGFSLVYIISNSIMPIIAREYSFKNFKTIEKIYYNIKVVIIFLGGGLAISGILIFKDLINIWAGPEGFVGELAILVLSIYFFVQCLNNLDNLIVNNINYIKETFWVFWLEMIINLLFSIVLCKRFGIIGVCFGLLFGSVIGPFIFLRRAITNKKEINISFGYTKQYLSVILFIIIAIFVNLILKNLYINSLILIVYVIIYYLANKSILKNIVIFKNK